MPPVTPYAAPDPLVTAWTRRDVTAHMPNFPRFTPRHATADWFSLKVGVSPHRDELALAQLYTQQSRRDYQTSYQTVLDAISAGKAMEVRWRHSKELPSFSPEFLKLYLSRFGPVISVHQLSPNTCLVTFLHASTLRDVLASRTLGLPYGRLFAKPWNPALQDNNFYRVVKHLEGSVSTRRRFNSLMDTDDRRGHGYTLRAVTRQLASNNRHFGPGLRKYVAGALGNQWRKPCDDPNHPKMKDFLRQFGSSKSSRSTLSNKS